MAARSILVIVLAVVCGLSSAMGLNMLAGRTKKVEVLKVETVPVAVAKVEILRGQLVTEELVEVKQWPKPLAPAGVFADASDLKDRAALQTLQPGEPLFEAKLATRGAVGGMATLIPNGMRAYTIQTKTVASNVAGFILPGNRVDVLLTFRGQTNDQTGGGSTTTLLQHVEVMAVGRQIEQVGKIEAVQARDVESVTLLVTPEQVARLDLGQSLGLLSLSLRNPNDELQSEQLAATIHDIRFGPRGLEIVQPTLVATSQPEPPAPAPVQPAVEPKVEPKPEPPRIAEVRTLRGQSWGSIRVVYPPNIKSVLPE
jgi:pilus assembly protein CpaB